jgi:O-methyltransferase involved in polyketide biosynthesis
VWEAVTQYLSERAVRATFGFLAKASSGSRITFTYVCRDFLEGKALYGWEAGYKRFVRSKIWLFGMDPHACSQLLEEYGWRVIEDSGYDQMADRYIAPTGRHLTATPVERMVYAEKL